MAGQSAAQCGPCVFGLRAIADATERLAAGSARTDDLTGTRALGRASSPAAAHAAIRTARPASAPERPGAGSATSSRARPDRALPRPAGRRGSPDRGPAATAGRHQATQQPLGEPVVLQVDRIRCDGYGMCAELLPELIELDDWGYPILTTGRPGRSPEMPGGRSRPARSWPCASSRDPQLTPPGARLPCRRPARPRPSTLHGGRLKRCASSSPKTIRACATSSRSGCATPATRSTRSSAATTPSTSSSWYDYDVAIIDWRMPGAEGIDVVAWARRNGKPTALLMLTARDAPADRIRGPRHGRRRLPGQALRLRRAAGPGPRPPAPAARHRRAGPGEGPRGPRPGQPGGDRRPAGRST